MDDYGQELHKFMGQVKYSQGGSFHLIISPLRSQKKVSAQNPRQYVLPIKYVIGIRAHRTGRPDKNKAKQTQIIQTKKSDRKEVSK